jgi:hypothetical protein
VYPESAIAVGTGFGQLFRGIGQVGGVAISAALFQTVLNSELHKRIHGDDAEDVGLYAYLLCHQHSPYSVQTITRIRHSATLVAHLPPDLQRAARDSYAISLRAVFIMAASSTFLAYLARLPVSSVLPSLMGSVLTYVTQIPDKNLDAPTPPPRTPTIPDNRSSRENALEISEDPEEGAEPYHDSEDEDLPSMRPPMPKRKRRLSTYESSEGGNDLESDTIGGSARPLNTKGSRRSLSISENV